jgi:hypothetical protein
MTSLFVLLLLFATLVLAIIAREVVLFYRWIATLPRIRTIARLDLSRNTSTAPLVVGSTSVIRSPSADPSPLPQSASSFAAR